MAESKDIEINQFPIVSSLSNKDYVVVSLDNGSQGRIKTSDLASVVAGTLGITNAFKFRGTLGFSADNITDNGCYELRGHNTNTPISYGILLSFNADGYYSLQVCTFKGDIYTRLRDAGVWSSWVCFASASI